MNNIKELEIQNLELKKAKENFRKENRELWSRIIVISSAIIGFSITMFSDTVMQSLVMIKIALILLFFNIVIGIFLFKNESEYENSQIFSNSLISLDFSGLNLPSKSDEEKDKSVALLYLQSLRVTKPSEMFFSEYAKNIFERNREKLDSWNMIKNPEKFYSYTSLYIVNNLKLFFFITFLSGIFFLILSFICI